MRRNSKLYSFHIWFLAALVALAGCKTSGNSSKLDTLFYDDDDLFEFLFPDAYIADAIPHYDGEGNLAYLCAYYGQRQGNGLDETKPILEHTIEKWEIYAYGDDTWQSGPIDPKAFEEQMAGLSDKFSLGKFAGSGVMVVAGVVVLAVGFLTMAPAVSAAVLGVAIGGAAAGGTAATVAGATAAIGGGLSALEGGFGMAKSFRAELQKETYVDGLTDATATQKMNNWKEFQGAVQKLRDLPLINKPASCDSPEVMLTRLRDHKSLEFLVDQTAKKTLIVQTSPNEAFRIVMERDSHSQTGTLAFYHEDGKRTLRASLTGTTDELTNHLLETEFMRELFELRRSAESEDLSKEDTAKLTKLETAAGPALVAIDSFWNPKDKAHLLTAGREARRKAPELFEELLIYIESKFDNDLRFKMEYR